VSSVPWEQNAAFIQKKEFILDPDWHSGSYYVQESNSMFLGYILEQINIKDKKIIVLDACAAPGGKSTHILDKINSDSVLIANEMLPKRNAILKENIIRWGNPNVIITQNDTENFKSLDNFFDLILVDAPCSGEGLLRKKPELAVEFTPENIEKCTVRQKEILDNLIGCVKENGFLIYSTCTFQTCENEAQIQYLLENGFELVPIDISAFPEITKGKIEQTFYFTFEQTKGSGFFIACLRKKNISTSETHRHQDFSNRNKITEIKFKDAEKWIDNYKDFDFYTFKNSFYCFPEKHTYILERLQQHLYITYFGVETGELKKDIFIPAHALALSNIINKNLNKIEIDKNNALQYLRKQDVPLENIRHKNNLGWTLLTYNHQNLGWVKILQDRINNYLPNHWRILQR